MAEMQTSGRDPGQSLLLTDLYELNMMQAYLEAGMTQPAVFEFFVRKLTDKRNFLVAAGLEQVVNYVKNAHFTAEELSWLASSGRFSEATLDYLAGFRFRGTIEAMPEGTLFYPDEPILRLIAPLPEAQFLESRIINLLHFQSVIASKAARIVIAARGRNLIDFGMRRAHGADAGLLAARASYLAGFDGTATVLAGTTFDLPIYGTMAHSFIQAFDNEVEAFLAFAKARPDSLILLLDTYDTETAAQKVVDLAPRLAEKGIAVGGVRLDSGDLADHAHRVRNILDEGGLSETKVFASGGLDEWEIDRLLSGGAPIDGFGVGTALTTSTDLPCLDCAYKLTEYAGKPKRKRSEGKATWPGRKQVFRRFDERGRPLGDCLSLAGDEQEGRPLLQPVLRDGELIAPLPPLAEIRNYVAQQLENLPEALQSLHPTASPYAVAIGRPLKEMTRKMDRQAV